MPFPVVILALVALVTAVVRLVTIPFIRAREGIECYVFFRAERIAFSQVTLMYGWFCGTLAW
jgi:hypothetical protein